MRLLFIIFLLSLTFVSFAQDYPDFRSKKDLFTRIVEKDIRSDVATFAMGGIDESVGKAPLKSIPITAATPRSISFAGDNIKVEITSAPFNPAQHKLSYYDEKYLVKIDNKPFFGDYGKLPKTNVSNVTVIVDKDTIQVPAAACTDLCNPVFSFMEKGVQKSQSKVFVSGDGRKIYVYMLKPENGGSYEVTWIIQDKKYLKRVVDFGFM